MADSGLQNIKLQDGYVKLLHTKGNDGVNDSVTQVGTSNGPNIVGTPLFLGANGENRNTNPMVMIKGIDSNAPFLVVTDSLGTHNDSVDNYPILTFYTDGSNTGVNYWGAALNKSRGVWNGKCMFDFATSGNRAAIEFMCHSNINANTSAGSGISGFPTIRKTQTGDNVMFAIPAGETEYWQFDRVKIASDTSADASFLADGVDAAWGNLTADGYYMGVNASLSDHDVDIVAVNSLNFESASDILIQSGQNDKIELFGSQTTNIHADGSGNDVATSVNIDAFALKSGASGANINIGCVAETSKSWGGDAVVVSGTDQIQIGTVSALNPNKTFLNSKEVISGSGMLVLSTAANTWTDYNALTEPTDYGALFFQDSDYSVATHSDWGRQLFLYDDEGSSPVLYTIDKTEVTKSKVLELRDCAITNTTPTSVTALPEGAAQVYVKNNNFIISYHDDVTNAAAYYYFALDGVTGASFTYSGTEPA